jgi:ferrous iron transport protein B
MKSTTPPITVGLVGNPNCGKTTILNKLAKSKYHVGNYPRVTVTVKEHQVSHQGQQIILADLPGIYALTSQTSEERASRDYIHSEKAEILVNVLDAGTLERSLFLTSQLIEMGRPTIFVLNMIDEARRKNIQIDEAALSSMLGGPVLKVTGLTGEGLAQLMDTIVEIATQAKTTKPVFIQYDAHLEAAVAQVQEDIQRLHQDVMNDHQCRWRAIKLLEGDDEMLCQEGDHEQLLEMVGRQREDLARDHGEECEMLFAHARYGFVHGMVLEAVKGTGLIGGGGGDNPVDPYDLTRKLDGLFLHKILGIPIFIGLLWLMFQATFTVGQYPMDWIDTGVAAISGAVDDLLPAGMVHDLVVDGIIAGMGGTIIFLPNIVILFFFMALFSETGYLPRAAFLMDRVMHSFGLHGKALIPLVMGFGCNVPAVMATRTIEDNRSRLITILVSPFMLCAARLPVFILFAGAFFSEMAGTMVFLMYMISIAMAMAASVLLNRIFSHSGGEAFVMELPPYRMPTIRAVLTHMWDKALNFLCKIAGVILVGSIVIWFLQEFPRQVEWSMDYDAKIVELQAQPATEYRDHALAKLERERSQEALAKSYLGRGAHTVAPVFAPLGFSWRDTVAILTGFVAKEVVVASYAVIYSQGEDTTEESTGLRQALAESMTPLVAFAFMVFALLYAPCLATVAAIRREAGGWRWAGFSVVFSLVLAWILAFAIVTAGGLLA